VSTIPHGPMGPTGARNLHCLPTFFLIRSSDTDDAKIEDGVRQFVPRPYRTGRTHRTYRTLAIPKCYRLWSGESSMNEKMSWRRIALLAATCVTGAATVALAQQAPRSEEHTSELQSRENLVCRLLLDKKKQ